MNDMSNYSPAYTNARRSSSRINSRWIRLSIRRIQQFVLFTLFLLVLYHVGNALSTESPRGFGAEVQPYIQPRIAPMPNGTLLVSTVDGVLHALDLRKGTLKWKIGTGHSLLSSGSPDTFTTSTDDNERDAGSRSHSQGLAKPVVIPGLDGSLYFADDGAMRRLPISISQLVAASPMRSSDNHRFVGHKDTSVLLVDRNTGHIKRAFTAGSAAQASSEWNSFCQDEEADLLWLGKSSYAVNAIDSKGQPIWNVSLSSYFSFFDDNDENNDFTEEQLDLLGFPHMVTRVDGLLHVLDIANGQILWSHHFFAPISTVHFVRDPSTDPSQDSSEHKSISTTDLITLPHYYLEVGKHKKFADAEEEKDFVFHAYYRARADSSAPVLSSYLYVDRTPDGHLYALRDVGHLPTDTSEAAASLALTRPSCSPASANYPHCLLGVHNVLFPQPDTIYALPQSLTPMLPNPPSPAALNFQSGRFAAASHYEEYDITTSKIDLNKEIAQAWWSIVIFTASTVTMIVGIPLVGFVWYQHQQRKQRKSRRSSRASSRLNIPIAKTTSEEDDDDSEDSEDTEESFVSPLKRRTHRKPSNNLTLNNHQVRDNSLSTPSPSPTVESFMTASDGSLPSNDTSVTEIVRNMTSVRSIGKLQLFTDRVLGTGSQGTIVYAGLYENRSCAIKRMVKSFCAHAGREIELLIRSDHHANVLRYYAKEEDHDFVYLALELCVGNLHDLVDRQAEYPDADRLSILQDMMTGLAHLHELNIAHRDVKPANILFTADYVCKIADMGLGKQLDLHRISFDSCASRSFGWQPAEVLNSASGHRTIAVDVFSAGCVMYYVLTNGGHPFGPEQSRELNICKGLLDLSDIKHLPDATDLITEMLHKDQAQRITAIDAVHHPTFWSDETKLAFLQDASDRLEADAESSELRIAIESKAAQIVGRDGWDSTLHRGLLDNLGKFRKYDFTSVRDLLRVIRNKRNHYRDLPLEVQKEVGPLPSGFLQYFMDRFPDLLIYSYTVISCFCCEPRSSPTLVSSYSPLDDEKDEELLARHSECAYSATLLHNDTGIRPPISLPLQAIPAIQLNTQFKRYFENISLKRLSALQRNARLKYRYWYNSADQWENELTNRFTPLGNVVNIRGFDAYILQTNELSTKRLHEIRIQEREERNANREERNRNNNSQPNHSNHPPHHNNLSPQPIPRGRDIRDGRHELYFSSAHSRDISRERDRDLREEFYVRERERDRERQTSNRSEARDWRARPDPS